MDPAAVHAASIRSLMDQYGDACPKVTLQDGSKYRCFASTQRTGSTLGVGGFGTDAEMEVVILTADFGNNPLPARGWTLTYDPTGKKLRIDEVKLAEGKYQVHLVLVDPTKGV